MTRLLFYHQSGNIMELSINGQAQHCNHQGFSPFTIEQLIDEMALDPRRIAVEKDLEIIPKSQYDLTALSEGDTLEIIEFIGGG